MLVMVVWAGGCAPRAQIADAEAESNPAALSKPTGLPAPAGGFTLAIADQTLTSDQIITTSLLKHFRPAARGNDFERFKRIARPQVEQLIVSRITNVLLYSKAKRQLGDKLDDALEKAVQTELTKFLAGFGGDYAKAQQALTQMGMDWESFKEQQKKMMLSQYYISSKLPDPAPVTYTDLLEEYNRLKKELFTIPETLRFRLIDIDIARIQPADPNQDRREAAGGLSNELIKRLNDGEDFAALAKQYSHGYRRDFGGLWNPVQPASLAYPYDVLAYLAKDIEPGQIAGPVEAGGHVFIMRLEEKKDRAVEPFENVQKQLEARIELDRRRLTLDRFGADVIQAAAIANKDAFVDFCLHQIYLRANQ